VVKSLNRGIGRLEIGNKLAGKVSDKSEVTGKSVGKGIF
jgi:hypothetical protein